MSDTTRTYIGGQYEILAELGRGGMAEVYKARHTRMGRLVALKVLPVRFLEDDEIRTRFEREARAGAQLEHDHIVTTYDVGVFDGRPYLAVAFIEGQTLAERLHTQDRPSPEETIQLIAPIAEALAYAHRNGVIHRDVKSSNIMIRAEDKRPILIDFGIAQASFTHKLTRIGEMLGTPRYMSPEQASAQEIDHRSDLYSLGVVLYECLTGTVPFQSPSTEVLLANIKHEPHRPVRERVPEVPLWLSEVVDRCLAKKPEDRFPDGNALAQALYAGYGKALAQTSYTRVPTERVVSPEPQPQPQADTYTVTQRLEDPRTKPPRHREAPHQHNRLRSALPWVALFVVVLIGGVAFFYLLQRLPGSGNQGEAASIVAADTLTTLTAETGPDTLTRALTIAAADTLTNEGGAEPIAAADTLTTPTADEVYVHLIMDFPPEVVSGASSEDIRESFEAWSQAATQFSDDYRFTFVLARMTACGEGAGGAGHHEVFEYLYEAAKMAIERGEEASMLHDVERYTRTTFSKLTDGHSEWSHLLEALENGEALGDPSEPEHH